MVVVGASHHVGSDGSVGIQVASMAWQKLTQMSDPLLTTATDEQWAFVAWCDFGHIVDGDVGTGAAQMVVAFGDDQGPFADTEVRASLADARLNWNSNGSLQSIPAFWTRVYETQGYIGRGAWNRLRRPAIWARIDRNGDPAQPTAPFHVAGISILAFRLDAAGVTTSDWIAHRYAPTQPQNQNAASRASLNWRTFSISVFSSIFDGSDDWLLSSAVRFRPATGGQGATLFQTTYTADGSTGAQVAILGRSLNFGWDPRGSQAGTVSHRFQAGAFALLDAPIDGGQIGVRGVDPNPSGTQGALESWEVFAIRGTKLGFFFGVVRNPGTPPPAGSDLRPMLFDPLATPVPANREIVDWPRPTSLDLEVVTCFSWLPQTFRAPPQRASWLPLVASNTGVLEQPRGIWRMSDHASFAAPEGVPIVWGMPVKNLGPADVQFQVWGTGNPVTMSGGSARQPADFCFAAWSWENDPDFAPDVVPAVPPAAYLSLGPEGLSVASLPSLPIAPDVEMPHSVARRGEVLEADDGTRVTWPTWLSVRRTFEWTWNGLTDAERASLLAVITAQFQWQRPRDLAPSGFLALGRPRITDQGSHRSAVSGTFVELLWTGG